MTSVIPLFRFFFTGKYISSIILVIQVKFQGKSQLQGQMRKYDFYEIQIATS